MMQLRIIKPQETTSPAKITVHKTGKMGFSKGAMQMLNLDEKRFAKFGYDEGDKLCIAMCGAEDAETFGIAKAGEYHYIAAKALLQELGIDYTATHTVIFDLQKTEEPDIFRMNKRIIKK